MRIRYTERITILRKKFDYIVLYCTICIICTYKGCIDGILTNFVKRGFEIKGSLQAYRMILIILDITQFYQIVYPYYT